MKNELNLPDNPVLLDFQEYVKKMVEVRGFAKDSVPEKVMLLTEEIGEMAKAARDCLKMKTCNNSDKYEFSLEVADVFIYLLDLCNLFDVDLEKAFREKESINKNRLWKV